MGDRPDIVHIALATRSMTSPERRTNVTMSRDASHSLPQQRLKQSDTILQGPAPAEATAIITVGGEPSGVR